MKKYLFFIAAAVLTLSCIKEKAVDSDSSANKVTVRVSIPEDAFTKVSLTEAADHKGMALAWQAGDAISINGENFSIKDGFSAHEAEFEGNAPTGSSFTIIYPGKYSSATAFGERSYASQVQDGNSSTAHLEYNAMISGVSEWAAPKFDRAWAADKGGTMVQNGVFQFRLQLPDEVTAATSLVLLAQNAIFPTTNEAGVCSKYQTLTLQNVTLGANHILEAYMMFSAAGVSIADGEVLTVAVITPDATYVRDFTLSAQTLTGGAQYTVQLKNFNEHIFDISTVADLEMFRDGVNSGDPLWQTVHASLKANLDLSGISDWTAIGDVSSSGNDSYASIPEGTPFCGVFDGENHTISGVKAVKELGAKGTYGFFGYLKDALVKNLKLSVDMTISSSATADAGAAVGTVNGSTVENVSVSGAIKVAGTTVNEVRLAVGGVAGFVFSSAGHPSVVKGCSSTAEMTVSSNANKKNGFTGVQAGGVVAVATTDKSDGTTVLIENCVHNGSISGDPGRCGGVVQACIIGVVVKSCENKGSVTNSFADSRVGGVSAILQNNSVMRDCSNYGDVIITTSNGQVGGLVCLISGDAVEVTGGGNHGRVVADLATYHGTLIANINTFNKVDDVIAGGAYASYNGGAYNYTVLTNENYLSYIGKIKSGAESKVTNIKFEEWDGYPAPPVPGQIEISTAADLVAFATRVNSGQGTAEDVIVLTGDIDCSSITEWTPIGNCSLASWAHNAVTISGPQFLGSFNGNNYKIKNLHMDFSNSGSWKTYGLFGVIGDGATVKNLIFDSSCSLNMTLAYGASVGMLAGLVQGATIENITNNAPITGSATDALANGANGRSMIGGIIGSAHANEVSPHLTNLHNVGAIGGAEAILNANKNVQTGANGVHVGGIAGFSTNNANAVMVYFENCVNDGDIYSSGGRTSGIVAGCNRYASLVNCVDHGDITFAGPSGNFRIGGLTCIAGDGSVLDGCVIDGDVTALNAASVAGLVCMVNTATVKIKNCAVLGSTVLGKGFKLDGSAQNYNGAFYGRCQNTAEFSNCRVSGTVGKSATETVTLTAENYFTYVGEPYATNTTINTTNISFATD